MEKPIQQALGHRNWLFPFSPPIKGLDKTLTSLTGRLFSLEKLPKIHDHLRRRPIGTEMAQAFARLGTKVTVVQRPTRFFIKKTRIWRTPLMNVLSEEGVAFI